MQNFIAAALFALGLVVVAAVTPADAGFTCKTYKSWDGNTYTTCN